MNDKFDQSFQQRDLILINQCLLLFGFIKFAFSAVRQRFDCVPIEKANLATEMQAGTYLQNKKECSIIKCPSHPQYLFLHSYLIPATTLSRNSRHYPLTVARSAVEKCEIFKMQNLIISFAEITPCAHLFFTRLGGKWDIFIATGLQISFVLRI